MSHSKSIYFIVPFLLLYACGNPDSSNVQPQDSQSSTDSMATPDVDNRDQSDTQLQDDKYYSTSASDDMANMYLNVGLSKDQIEKFEDDYKQRIKDLKTQGSENLNKQSMQDAKDQSIKSIASSEQYSRYLDWKKVNPVVN